MHYPARPSAVIGQGIGQAVSRVRGTAPGATVDAIPAPIPALTRDATPRPSSTHKPGRTTFPPPQPGMYRNQHPQERSMTWARSPPPMARRSSKDWGDGQPIVFSHGWPLSADDWDAQMLFFSPAATASSPTTGVATADPARPATAT